MGNDGEDLGGCIGILIVFAIITAVVIAVAGVGTVWGAITAIGNYIKSFRKNVAFEKVTT